MSTAMPPRRPADPLRPVDPTPERSIGQLVSDAVDDVRAIVQHEKDLAKAELTAAAKKGGAGAALLVVAAGLVGLGTIYLLVAAAEALIAAGMTRWGGFLVVGGAAVVLALLLALVGVLLLKRVKGPQRTVEQGKGTVQDVKDALHHDDPDAPDTSDQALQMTKTAASAHVGTRKTGDG